VRIPCLGLALVLAASRLAADVETAPLPFRLLDRGAIVVPVSLGGRAVRPFLLDTGASRSAVTAGVVRLLGLPPAGQAMVATAVGTVAAPLVRLDAAAMGAGLIADVTALVVSAGQLGQRAAVDGLIGQDVLASRAFTIDYRRRTLTWHGAGPSPPGVRLPLTIERGTAVVTAMPSAGPGAPLRLIPDTGADQVVLFAGGGRALPPLTPLDTVRLRTLAGERIARRVVLDELRLGAVRLREQSALVLAGPAPAGAHADGLLPLHLFSRVTFNGPEGYLIVEQ
jgi:predicted aspartyl protease